MISSDQHDVLLQRVSVGAGPKHIEAIDLDGGGALDLVVTNDVGGDVSILRNDWAGQFADYRVRAGVRPYATSTVASDQIGGISAAGADEFAAGDGYDDVVYSAEAGNRLEVRYGRGNSSFDDVYQQQRADGLAAPKGVVTADMNRDGITDLVVTNSATNELFVYLGNENETYATAQRFFTGTAPSSLVVEDLNDDGWLDVTVSNQGSNDLSLFFGDATGSQWSLAHGPRLRQQQPDGGEDSGAVLGLGPVDVDAVDYSDDGIVDIAVTNANSNNVFVLPGIGQGFFDDLNPDYSRCRTDC